MFEEQTKWRLPEHPWNDRIGETGNYGSLEKFKDQVKEQFQEEEKIGIMKEMTDEEFFKGSLDDLTKVSEVVKIPVLRKDFILDKFQILEARAAGADAILLIVASHTDAILEDLFSEARRLGLDVLCEVHTRQELERAVYLGAEVIGVNCRDLTTMQVNPRIHMDLVKAMPTAVLRVAESGIKSPADVDRLLEAGYDAFLVGEALMRQPDPAAALALLMEKEYASELRGQWG